MRYLNVGSLPTWSSDDFRSLSRPGILCSTQESALSSCREYLCRLVHRATGNPREGRQLHKASTGSSSRRRFTAIRSGGSAIRTAAFELCTVKASDLEMICSLKDFYGFLYALVQRPTQRVAWRGAWRGALHRSTRQGILHYSTLVLYRVNNN